jgi:hypothetical protein
MANISASNTISGTSLRDPRLAEHQRRREDDESPTSIAQVPEHTESSVLIRTQEEQLQPGRLTTAASRWRGFAALMVKHQIARTYNRDKN